MFTYYQGLKSCPFNESLQDKSIDFAIDSAFSKNILFIILYDLIYNQLQDVV